ncbi:MAG: bifunctional (p)ppGpp synthetase/guanosine-3',5'-bis(diphosphate) 3'-pyrophosphohydrolase [Betaproteobacteria bacterium]|nr:bifunctional (p)ppGpp synthetase/guanosine-3',5'-bis(diphosphate) 3'-pyrophosphohydrolase [Betaproteobacteria bacterium]
MEANLTLPESFSYLKEADLDLLKLAYQFSERAHAGQYRKDGAPYFTHPLAVAELLAGWHLDVQTLMAALLHDVVEDTGVRHADIVERFGKQVATLVDGVTKLDKIQFESKAEAQAENFRKMLLAMARDVRVILVKLADRLHNMRTLDAMRPEQIHRIAQETLEIYAPIANRLGLNKVYQELEDIAFLHLHPNRYRVIEKAVKAAKGNRKEVVEKIRAAIEQKLAGCHINALVKGREKHLNSIYRKMHDKHLSFSEVFDIYGFRVVVEDIPNCYLTLGALHGLYKPIPGKFKDYIAIPKPNGYQSLHTTLFGPFGAPLEVQIRSQDMHRIAEAGVASHWLYKTGDAPLSDVQRKTHQWLQSLLDIQADSRDSTEFLEHIKVDLFPDEVYVFTPKGRIIALPRGATAVDFAYSVHTDVGNHCVGGKINGEFMPLSTPLRNGDRVEILTSESARPNPAWAHFAHTGKARAHIRSALKKTHRHESISLGEQLLGQALRALGGEDAATLSNAQWEKLAKESGRHHEDTLSDIGLGKKLAFVVARQLLSRDSDQTTRRPHGPMLIRGAEGVAVRLGKCCHPIPGDPIIGQIKKEQGLVIHTHDCPQVRNYRADPDRWVDVAWATELEKLFDVSIRVTVANQRGVLAKVAASISNEGSDIDNVHMEEETGNYTNLFFTVKVQNRLHLARLMRDLRSLPEVVRIQRLKN